MYEYDFHIRIPNMETGYEYGIRIRSVLEVTSDEAADEIRVHHAVKVQPDEGFVPVNVPVVSGDENH